MIGPAERDVVLELVEAGITCLPSFFISRKRLRFLVERPELAGAVMDNANRGGETKLDGAFADGDSVPLILHTRPDHGVDVDVKLGMLAQPLQLLVQDLE